MKKKRVVHITTVHPPFDTRIFYKQCKSLADEGYDVYLIVTLSEDFNKMKFKENNIHYITLKRYNNRFQRIFVGVKDALNEAIKLDASIYHIHDPELLLVTSKLKKTGARIIYDMHEDYFTSIRQKQYLPRIIRPILSIMYSFFEKYKTKNLEVIIAEKYYKEKYPKGFPILNYPILKEEKYRVAYSNKVNKILYTGNVTEDRGALIHAQIPSYVENITVTFVGKCLSKLAERMNVVSTDPSRIVIKGINKYVPREEIDKEYNNSKWLAGLAIFPPTEHYMKKELTKFFEYMYAGLPIIASDFPEWRKFIEKYDCGLLVEHNNKNQIKAAINYLKNNPKRGIEMARNGQRAIIEELNWDNERIKLVNLYKTLIES